MKNKEKKTEEKRTAPVMDRKEAIKKTGYLALSAATMMLLISIPNKAVASSPEAPPAWDKIQE
jgi:hypothetical protein